ncbi:MAG: sugar nucleotide-binding protein, partial [Pseudomonadota bacterium]
KVRPDFVINCIGAIKQKDSRPETMIELNAVFPWRVARMTQESGAKLVHLSTDCVFDGKDGNYFDNSRFSAVDTYGLSKALGEISNMENVLTLRTSIIGRELDNHLSLVDWFLSQPDTSTLKGYRSAIYSGFPTLSLAKIIRGFLNENEFVHGLFNISSDPINKYDLLCRVRELFDRSVKIEPVDEPAIDRSLNSQKIREISKMDIPHSWDQLIGDLLIDKEFYERLSQ